MSRLYDILRRDPAMRLDQLIASNEHLAPVFDVTNVSEYLCRHYSHTNGFGPLLTANAAPPFKSFFLESNVSKGTLSSDLMLIKTIARWGFMVYGFEPFESIPEILVSQMGRRNQKLADEVERARSKSRWAVATIVYQQGIDGRLGYAFTMWWFANDAGRITSRLPWVTGEHAVPIEAESLRPFKWHREIDGYITFFIAAFLAISLMHCKNVSTVEHVPDAPLQKKTVKKHGVPLTRYYTLEIGGMKDVLRREGRISEVGLERALHICRGHFATYTPDRPLFGKHTGTFWVPQHLRGTETAGRVLKDYAVADQLVEEVSR